MSEPTENGHKRVYFLAHGGEVQGVGFRYYTRERANHHKVTGWVRNTHDNKVEGEAQGHHESIKSFLKDVDKGPRHSKVVKLDKEERDLVEDETDFACHAIVKTFGRMQDSRDEELYNLINPLIDHLRTTVTSIDIWKSIMVLPRSDILKAFSVLVWTDMGMKPCS